MICVYKITSPSQKIYVGSTISFARRIYKYKTLRCKSQRKLYNSFIKYGFDKHKIEILDECNFDNLKEKEAYYGQLYNCLSINGLNCNLPQHDEKFSCISEETRKNMCLASSGRKHTEETKNKISTAKKGIKFSKETRGNMSTAKKFKKQHYSEETKSKMRLAKIKYMVLNTQTGIFYNGMTEAGKSINKSGVYVRDNLFRYKINQTSFIIAA